MSDNRGPITQEEMVELFGETMPIAAVNLLFNSSAEMTIGEVRERLRDIANEWPKVSADMKPASFPFLAIARRYGLEYTDALKCAQQLRTWGRFEYPRWLSMADRDDFARDLWDAHCEFGAIQRGEIDWMTGEPRRRAELECDGRHPDDPAKAEYCEDEGCPHHGTPHICIP